MPDPPPTMPTMPVESADWTKMQKPELGTGTQFTRTLLDKKGTFLEVASRREVSLFFFSFLFVRAEIAVSVRVPVDGFGKWTVAHLKAPIANDHKYGVEPSRLELFLAKTTGDDAWLRQLDAINGVGDTRNYKHLLLPNTKLLAAGLASDKLGQGTDEERAAGKSPVHVLVVGLNPNATWNGSLGSSKEGEGVDLNDERTLSRSALTAYVIERLEATHALLVNSPPMTGKTSLAALLSRALVNKHMVENKKAAVFSFSLTGATTFEEKFEGCCKVTWKHAKSTLPKDRVVYIVLDETQLIYGDSEFWRLVESVRVNWGFQMRILMFAAYNPGVVSTGLASPVDFYEHQTVGVERLNFSQDEVSEYVAKWFKGISCFGGSLSPAMGAFCANLEELTGRHVGLCASAISALNEVYRSCEESGGNFPSAGEWIRMLQTGSLYKPNDGALFEMLTSTRAVNILETFSSEELDRLERAVRVDFRSYSTFEDLIPKGVLVQDEEGRRDFSSPVMWRYFVKLRVDHVTRAHDRPKSLPDMIARVMQAIDYGCITLHRSIWGGIPTFNERACQMEFFKAAYRCTPGTFVPSIDVGGLFGSSGHVDFTIHGGGISWGIELLREGNKLVEHIKHFSPSGRYSSLGFECDEFYLIDFRCVASVDDEVKKGIEADMRLCEQLSVVCYDARVKDIVVFNSDMEVVYRAKKR